jgi:hypothetical protein
MDKKEKLVLRLNLFNAVSAIGGGIALITGAINQPSWLNHMGFKSLYFPGVILLAIVGGSALLAVLATYKRITLANLLNVLAGLVMIFWIVVEICSIRAFHFLQGIYFVTGALIVWLAPKETQ